jgi:hypothetical protein
MTQRHGDGNLVGKPDIEWRGGEEEMPRHPTINQDKLLFIEITKVTASGWGQLPEVSRGSVPLFVRDNLTFHKN